MGPRVRQQVLRPRRLRFLNPLYLQNPFYHVKVTMPPLTQHYKEVAILALLGQFRALLRPKGLCRDSSTKSSTNFLNAAFVMGAIGRWLASRSKPGSLMFSDGPSCGQVRMKGERTRETQTPQCEGKSSLNTSLRYAWTWCRSVVCVMRYVFGSLARYTSNAYPLQATTSCP